MQAACHRSDRHRGTDTGRDRHVLTLFSLEINDGSIFNLTWNKARVAFKEYGPLLATDRFYVVLEEQGIK